jgi:hypothetical protein
MVINHLVTDCELNQQNTGREGGGDTVRVCVGGGAPERVVGGGLLCVCVWGGGGRGQCMAAVKKAGGTQIKIPGCVCTLLLWVA